jgi:hypothetical protein
MQSSEIPRNICFRGRAIPDNEIFIIADAILDECFADNPLLLNESKIRFYSESWR